MNLKITFTIIISLGLSILMEAQDKESYKDFVQQRNKEYRDWRKKANKEFSEYLSKEWVEFNIQRGKKDPIGEVPDKPQYFSKPKKTPSKSHGIPSEYDMSSMLSYPKDCSASYVLPNGVVEVNFYGIKKNIHFDSKMKLNRVVAKEKEVAIAWAALSESSYSITVDEIASICSELSLNDWATYSFIKLITEAVYNEENTNEKVLTQMFFLCQLQYKARIGASGNNLILLLPFKESIYQNSFISDNGEDFYIFGYNKINGQSPLYSFNEDFSFADNKIGLVIDKPMAFGMDSYKKVKLTKWSSILGEDITVPVNNVLILFTLDYPQLDLVTYHKSSVDRETAKSIFRAIKLKILKEGMNQEESVAFILNLVQYGFDYKTDYEMFGRSKPLFIEESLYYGANNCKDRVLIFSWLVRNTLNLNTIMFGYPGHVSCGVEFKQPVSGDYFKYKGHDYVMCDPTYIGAPIGVTMPKFKAVTPTFIEI